MEATSNNPQWVTLLCGAAERGREGNMPFRAPKRLLWQIRLQGGVQSSPVQAEEFLYVTCLDGALHAIDVLTGREAWKKETGSRIRSTPVISGDAVLFGNDSGQVFAVDRATGKGLWEVRTGAEVFASPVVFNGTTFFGSADGHFYASALQ